MTTIISPRVHDLGGFQVRRAVPTLQARSVGPFVFVDHMGPAVFAPGQGIDVRPHPHIGLGTVTYLYQGHFHHRDSIGTDQVIHPGAVNWMVAGKGVTHSERTDPAVRKTRHSLFGIQTWIALPEDREDIDPTFEHHGKDALPVIEAEGASGRLILGTAWGETAPATLYSDAFYIDMRLEPGARFPLPDEHEDRGIHITEGSITVAGQEFAAGQMMVFRPGDRITVAAGAQGARLMVLGGATLNGPRYIWWNFVSSSRDKIEVAKAEWRARDWGQGLFDLPPTDRGEFIPLPER